MNPHDMEEINEIVLQIDSLIDRMKHLVNVQKNDCRSVNTVEEIEPYDPRN